MTTRPEGDERYEDIFKELDISPEMKDSIVSYIRRRLAPKPIKIRADIEVTCFAYEGIDAIKAALQAGLDTTTNSEVEIKLIAPPMYVCMCGCKRISLPYPTLNPGLASTDPLPSPT